MNSKRPNLLWICLEDVSPWFGCYGERLAVTPHIDRLAEKGLCFERCFSPAPVCSPARTGLITGCLPTTLGAHHHRSSRTPCDSLLLPSGVRPLPEVLRDAGYLCFNAGKDDYNFVYDREALYPGPYQSLFHQKEGPPAPWEQLPAMQPFFGQLQLDGGKAKRDPRVRARKPDPRSIELPPYYPDDPVFRENIALHHACIQEMDAQVGAVLARLDALGLSERTLVILFSDHGMDGLRHKQFCYDGGLHVPLIIASPGTNRISRGRRSELVNSLDIAATTLALAGLDPASAPAGRDLLGPGYVPRDAVFGARDRCDFTLDGIRTVRTSRYRYIRNFHPQRAWLQPQYRSSWPEFLRWRELADSGVLSADAERFALPTRPAEEFYDVHFDPHQVRNLADSPAHAEERDRHRQRLDHWMRETKDPVASGFAERDLLATLLRWKDDCVDPEFAPVRARHAELIARYPEQRPWKCGDLSALEK